MSPSESSLLRLLRLSSCGWALERINSRFVKISGPARGKCSAVLAVGLATMCASLWATDASAANKLDHYCRHWGAAGLFADDAALLKANPLGKLKVRLNDGSSYDVLLLYINKGHELDEQPREWREIWQAFSKVCPGYPKPDWLTKLEEWKAGQLKKTDPGAARSLRRIAALRRSAKENEVRARALRADIETSSAYLQITGGSPTWFTDAQAKIEQLSKVVALATTRYTVVGRLVGKTKTEITIKGVAISPDSIGAPGTRTEPVQIIIADARAAGLRPNDNYFATGLYQAAVVDAAHPRLTFSPTFSKTLRKTVTQAKAELRRLENIIRNGKAKIETLLRPVRKLNELAARQRADAKKLEAQR